MIGRVRIALVVAMSENGVIGRGGGLPWRLKSDLRQFKAITTGKPLIMGSSTWDSLPRKPLPGRLNLVLSRDLKFEAPGAVVCNTLFEALDIAREHAVEEDAEEICVVGGANVFAQTLPKADRLYLTTVHATLEGDVHFPPFDPAQWRLQTEESFPQSEDDEYSFTLRIMDKVA